MIGDVESVLKTISSHDKFLLACHVNPDPDCVGSMLALDWLLEKLGKTSVPLSHHPMQPQWSFLPRIERVIPASHSPIGEEDAHWDALVVIDCELERTGDAARWADHVDTVINIDHHVTNTGTGNVNLIRTQAAATGEMVYKIIQEAGVTIDEHVATLLYAAIMSDTGSFRYSNTTAKAFRVASDLVQAGARPDIISREIYDTRSWNYVQLLSKALDTVDVSDDGQVAWICLTEDMLRETGARRDETDGLIHYPRIIAGVEVALIFQELEDQGQIRVSFRSRDRVDVSKLAQHFGGGGHERAAGCMVKGSLDAVKQQVLEKTFAVVGESD